VTCKLYILTTIKNNNEFREVQMMGWEMRIQKKEKKKKEVTMAHKLR
jgi:hypothetical protein